MLKIPVPIASRLTHWAPEMPRHSSYNHATLGIHTTKTKEEDTIILHSHYTNNNRDLRDEFYEVSSHAVGQDELQVVQLLHGCEVGAAHPDDDNGQRLLGCLHKSRLGRFHVVDFSVRDDQQHVVLLLRLAMFVCMYVCMGLSTYS